MSARARTQTAGIGLLVALALPSAQAAVAFPRGAAEPPPLRIVSSQAAALRPVAPPPSRGAAADASDVAFVSRTRGFLAVAAAGAHWDGSGTGRIEGTGDGGVTWTTVWSRARTAVTRIGFTDARHLFAVGATYPARAPQRNRPAPLLLLSSDGGTTWHAVRPSLPAAAADAWPGLDFQFPSRRVGYALADPDETLFLDGLLRTSDGGRHWILVPPRGLYLTAVDFLGPAVGYATGFRRGSGASCAAAVFRTSDGGARWRLLPGSCRPYGLDAVEFLDAHTGFVGGGEPYYARDRPFQALLSTRDGGRSWRTVFRGRVAERANLPLNRLAFADPRHGLAVSAGCKTGQNGPCGGALLATLDGGRSWHDTGRSATRIASVDRGHAWLAPVCGCGAVLWRTVDGGARWQPLARPENVGFQTIEAAGSWLLLDSAAGMFRSRDGGRRWTAFAPPSAPGASPYGPRIARPGLLADVDTGAIHVSNDGGRSWTSASLPVGAGSGIATASFADPEHGLAAEEGFGCIKGGGLSASHLFATADGGSSWEALPTPAFAVDQLVAVPGLTAATAEGADCGANWLALSRDGGRDWNVQAFPHGQACTASLAPPATVWLVCGGNRLLASTDGGSAWTELSGWLTIGAAAPVSSRRGWLVGTLRGEANPTLWQTTDGGRHWSERWPALPIRRG